MQKSKVCSSMNAPIANDVGSVLFPCPNCGEEVIARSYTARRIGAKYTCKKCGFEGPN